MKLVASAIVRNELGRYLDPWLEHLAEFCDGIVVLDDASTDGTFGRAMTHPAVTRIMQPADGPVFDRHEGQARQALLDLTLGEDPTHVLAIDADEFVSDGPALRAALEEDSRSLVWTVEMEEAWELDGDCICIRQDGGWRPHGVPVVYRVASERRGPLAGLWRIENKALACGRVPLAVSRSPQRTNAGVSLLHFGWANEGARRARYERYMRIDGGRYHAKAHLESILGPWELAGRPWPPGLEAYRAQITKVVTNAA